MSWWTRIYGTIKVDVPGMTQKHKDFILDEVLRHLPRVTGSEGDMQLCVSQEPGYSDVRYRDELGRIIPDRNEHIQSMYLITISSALMDRDFLRTLREFTEWVCRLSKRLWLIDILVSVSGPYDTYLFNDAEPYESMWEYDRDEDDPPKDNWTEWLWPNIPDELYCNQ